ncbi:hypothetical protein M1P56_09750 [Streptomyces sp. HU2014]|uniref:hypothetical protein n=1 Tax=Streptomyces sp. HU2014 TaxID=2939414 RepID=UPI00200C3895|nr:hypothetical protein [Streptomyces sp. HU2014]UQI44609.1 hypothetical protein M1P56_09750 [Streptomyces sp. HU2014]
MQLKCEFDPSHIATLHIVTKRPDGRGLKITAHVCADDSEAWTAQLYRLDGHQLVSRGPINDHCRPYGLCKNKEK